MMYRNWYGAGVILALIGVILSTAGLAMGENWWTLIALVFIALSLACFMRGQAATKKKYGPDA